MHDNTARLRLSSSRSFRKNMHDINMHNTMVVNHFLPKDAKNASSDVEGCAEEAVAVGAACDAAAGRGGSGGAAAAAA
jgi:hypothetical protein